MFRCLRVIGVGLCALACAAVCRAEESSESLQRQFEAEYPAALQALMDYYGHLVMEVRHEWTRAKGYPQLPPARFFELASRGQSVRVIRYPANSSLRIKDPAAWVGVAHPRLSFSLSPAKGAAGFSVNGIDSYEGRLASMRLDAWPLFGAYAVYEMLVQDFTREPGFQWTRFEALGGEEDLVRAAFVRPDPEMPAADMAGWFLFTRSGSWALRGWLLDHARNPGQGYRQAEITYRPERSPQGIPVLSKVVYRARNSTDEGDQPALEEVWTVTRIEPADIPESAFTLPAFGLPDVAPEIDPRRRLRWIFLAGLAAMAAGAILAWARHRRARQTPRAA